MPYIVEIITVTNKAGRKWKIIIMRTKLKYVKTNTDNGDKIIYWTDKRLT